MSSNLHSSGTWWRTWRACETNETGNCLFGSTMLRCSDGAGDLPALARCRQRAAKLAHVFGWLPKLALQQFGPDQYRQCGATPNAVDVSGCRLGSVRDYTAGDR